MLDAFYANPMAFIGIIFALVGAFGALLFGAGFLAGLPGVFTMMSNNDHQSHHTLRITWGAALMTATFIVWELVRIIASWFGYPSPNLHAFGVAISALLIVLLACWIVVLLTDTITKKGADH
ncbi:MAG: hypothetical protein V4474_00435 [Patescibacteria group bacterium]